MNRPDKPGELSIDEILASIRQNVSEEPDAPQQSALDPAVEASPPVVPSNAAAPPTPPSLQERLSGAFKSGPSAEPAGAAGTNGTKRPLPFDQDLADILDESDAAGVARATPKPEMRVSPELGSLGGKPPSVTAPLAEPAAVAKASSSPSSDPAPSTPLVAPAPFGRAFGDGAAAAPRPQTFGFPPLTKRSGFYPPERPEPVLPPVRSDDLAKAQPSSPSLTPKDASPAPSFSSTNPASTPEPATRFPDFGSVVPSDVVGRGQPTSGSAFGAPPRAGGATETNGVNGSSLRLPSLESSAASPTLSAPVVPNLTVPAPVTTKPSFSAKPDEVPFGAPSVARSPEPTPGRKPLGESAAASVATPSIGQDAAADALGALAQGLAASTAKSDASDLKARPVPERAEVPSAGVQAVAPVSAASGAVPNAAAAPPAPAPDSGAAPGRTLEDVVADMLRPMLQKWVAENMPRIMEKALRSEMQRTLGSGGGSKPPGS